MYMCYNSKYTVSITQILNGEDFEYNPLQRFVLYGILMYYLDHDVLKITFNINYINSELWLLFLVNILCVMCTLHVTCNVVVDNACK